MAAQSQARSAYAPMTVYQAAEIGGVHIFPFSTEKMGGRDRREGFSATC
jgi:hypothetical protein